jgi:hypothetical protein
MILYFIVLKEQVGRGTVKLRAAEPRGDKMDHG